LIRSVSALEEFLLHERELWILHECYKGAGGRGLKGMGSKTNANRRLEPQTFAR